MSNLKDLQEEDIKDRLINLQKDYKQLIDGLLPLLQRANLLEKEINLLISELEKR